MWFWRRFFYVFPIICLWELMTPRAWPFLTPGAWLAGFIKRTSTLCYTQNMKALGLVVLEKKIFFLCFFPMTPPGRGPYGPKGHGMIYKKDLYTLLHTNYESSGPCDFGEEDFFMLFPIVCLWPLIPPWGGAIFDPRGMVDMIYKEDH